MSTYKEKLDYTEETKNLIKTAITKKGVAVGEGDTFRSYADKIDSIPAARPMGLAKIKTKDEWNPEGVFNYNFADSIESIDWTEFNKLGITSMVMMFNSWQGQTLDIANLSTTGVKGMNSMFGGCKNLTSLDVSHFDTSNVTNMSNMFYMTDSLESLNLSSFDTTNVTNMGGMFNYIGRNVSSSKEVSIIFGSNWASNPSITIFELVGASYSPANFSHDTGLDLFNKIAIRDNTPVLKLSNKTYDKMTAEEIKIATDKGWTVTRV